MMRRMLGRAALAIPLAALTMLGCDETQPVQGPAKNVEVQFSSTAKVEVYDVWDAKRVKTTRYPTQPDREPTVATEELGLWCEVPATEAERFRDGATYPLRYRVSIEKIPAGSSTPELLTDETYVEQLASLTFYDPTPATPAQTHPIDWSIDVSDPTKPDETTVIEFQDGRRLSTASRAFLVLSKIPSGTPTSYGSRCPYAQFGGAGSGDAFLDPAVAGSSPTFGVTMATGDTIVVRAKKDDDSLLWARYVTLPPGFESSVLVNGVEMTTDLVGRSTSDPLTDEGIAYSFTTR